MRHATVVSNGCVNAVEGGIRITVVTFVDEDFNVTFLTG